MDITFSCEKCAQQLEVDASAAGSKIECPTCGAKVDVPQPDSTNVHVGNPVTTSAAAKEHHHFVVPVSEKKSESLIEKPQKPLEVAA
ncbi:MAG: hypothetical protein MJA27_03535, partial [Pseudanabaenales cyanobacterium]|nr:hypothetical protein [Pseudanabaenales cyanobacterium]